MTAALEGGEGSASRPGRSLSPGKARYPLYRRLGGPQGRFGQVRKFSPPTEIRFPDRQARSQSLYRLSYPAHTTISRTEILWLNRCYLQKQPKCVNLCFIFPKFGKCRSFQSLFALRNGTSCSLVLHSPWRNISDGMHFYVHCGKICLCTTPENVRGVGV